MDANLRATNKDILQVVTVLQELSSKYSVIFEVDEYGFFIVRYDKNRAFKKKMHVSMFDLEHSNCEFESLVMCFCESWDLEYAELLSLSTPNYYLRRNK